MPNKFDKSLQGLRRNKVNPIAGGLLVMWMGIEPLRRSGILMRQGARRLVCNMDLARIILYGSGVKSLGAP